LLKRLISTNKAVATLWKVSVHFQKNLFVGPAFAKAISLGPTRGLQVQQDIQDMV
jgi:hypothetical protein